MSGHFGQITTEGISILVHHSATAVKYPDWILVVFWSSDDETLQPVSSRLQIAGRSCASAKAKEITKMSK